MTCAAFAPLCTITGATTLRDEQQDQERQAQSASAEASASAASLVLRRQVIIHVMSSILVFVLLLPLCFAWPNATSNATGPDPSMTNVTAANGTNITTVVNGTDLVGPNNFTNFTTGAALSQFSTRVAPANAAAPLLPLDGTMVAPPEGGPPDNGAVLTKVTQFSPVGPEGGGRDHADRARAGFVDHQANRDRAPDDRSHQFSDALLDDREARIHLVPAGMPFVSVDYDKQNMMLMEVALPTTEFFMCTSNKQVDRPKCSGEFELDLSSSNGRLEIAFQATDGHEIEIVNDRGKLELAFKARNMGHLFVCNDDMKQKIKNFVPEVTGSRIDGLLGSPKEAKIEIDPCSLDTRVEFDLSKSDHETIRFKRISWTVPYKPRMFRRDESKLTYKTNTAMWIMGNKPRLVKV